MSQGTRRPEASTPGERALGVDLAGAFCPTEWEHRVEIPSPGGGSVTVIALSCPNCTRLSASDELTQIVAARRRTLACVGVLSADARADLAADGTLDRLYLGTVAEVREAAERCREWLGVDLPAALTDAEQAAAPSRAQVAAVLDAAGEWVAALPPARR